MKNRSKGNTFLAYMQEKNEDFWVGGHKNVTEMQINAQLESRAHKTP